MNPALIDRIAAAVLYEGYLLYPYRPSVKNQHRWTFGGLAPRRYCESQGGSDAWKTQTQCLLRGNAQTRLSVSVRFLHLVSRRVGELDGSPADWPEIEEPPLRFVEALQVGDELVSTWQEAVEQTLDLGAWNLNALLDEPRQVEFAVEGRRDCEPLRRQDGAFVGAILRDRQPLHVWVELAAESVGKGAFRVSANVENRTPFEGAETASRDEAMQHGLASTHMILHVQDGAFVSLIDPPEDLLAPAAECRNVGAWPVLVGEPGESDAILSAPIILHDYPQVAPESPGDLFDATEIDEILTLRILTLSDAEKRSMAALDAKARALLERTESLDQDQLRKLHGAVRDLRPTRKE